jgi:hypothetical protein
MYTKCSSCFSFGLLKAGLANCGPQEGSFVASLSPDWIFCENSSKIVCIIIISLRAGIDALAYIDFGFVGLAGNGMSLSRCGAVAAA